MIKPEKLTGRRYWRSLDELDNSPEFKKYLEREFPEDASVMGDPVTRRTFLRLMGASVALASFSGCGFLRRPEDHIVPYNKMPEHVIPGKPLHYATSFDVGGVANGLLVESHVGRPTKIEGSALHPHSLGAADAFAQASILELYDPDRSNEPAADGKPATWAEFESFWRAHAAKFENDGQGLAFLDQDVPSPLLNQLKDILQAAYPNAAWHTYDPVSRENTLEGARIAFGRAVETHPDFSKADVVVSLDCDFLGAEPGHVRSIKQYSKRRKVRSPEDTLNRLYVIEPGFSVTGANADHRVRLKPSQIPAFAAVLAGEINRIGGAAVKAAVAVPDAPGIDDATRNRARLIAADLIRVAKSNRALVVAGRRQPSAVHALVHAINAALGGVGNTVTCTPSRRRNSRGIAELADAALGGKIHTLVILGGNPAYDAPADIDFAGALKKIGRTVHIGLHRNETGRACAWHLPESHFLESWGDRRATDGLVSIVQPLVYPLYASKSQAEFLALLAGHDNPDGRRLLRDFWNARDTRLTSDSRWKKILHDGIVPETQDSPVQLPVDFARVAAAMEKALSARGGQYELVFAEDISVFDGRYANNGWLQELPDPMSKVVWDNPALMSVATAAKLGVKNESEIEIASGGRKLRMAAWIVPGIADGVLILNLGYGRAAAGQVGDHVGFNTYALRTSGGLDMADAAVVSTGKTHIIASTQEHFAIDEYGAETRKERAQELVQEATVKEYRQKPDFARHWPQPAPDVNKSIFKEFKYDTGNQWGMTIDLNACVGCNACTVACQAENNIPIVGKAQVRTGREMHWIRLDRYFIAEKGHEDEATAVSQPIACQQCENAPCETVCPVAATTHSEEGLNDMTYNRCIGTRYCQNNCPYKVRRFNFLNWNSSRDMIQRGKAKDLFERVVQKDTRGTLQMAHNPDVTVRSRGVMEKCTYCVQRISSAKIDAKAKGLETVPDSMAPVPACAQTCPADAIVMGNINDPESRVSKLRALDRGYEILAELNVRPRTTFLAKLRNPNPEWA